MRTLTLEPEPSSISWARAPEMARLMGPRAQLIELGSGSSVKVRILLDAMDDPAAYIAVDISRDHLKRSASALAAEVRDVQVAAVCADYSAPFPLPNLPGPIGRRVAFFPGSTIGNLEPDEALAFLRSWVRRLGPGAAMLVGVDLRKDAATLNAAYDDAQGVTAAFSLNLLVRANAELGADFNLRGFVHEAIYDTDLGRVAIHLRSLARQTAHIGDHVFAFDVGERIHVEHSYKYTIAGFQALARRAGFEPAAAWTDPAQLFSVHHLTTPPA